MKLRVFLSIIIVSCLMSAVTVGNIFIVSQQETQAMETADIEIRDAVNETADDSGETVLAEGEESVEAADTNETSAQASSTQASSTQASSAQTEEGQTVQNNGLPYYADPMRRKIDFDSLEAINSDVASWIYVPGTHIDYYIMQEQVPDEFYYLWRNIYKYQSEFGSIFFPAYREGSIEEDAHQLIFGHHMAYGEVAFSDLMSYHDRSYAQENPYVYLYYPDRVERWKVWSGGTFDPYDDIYYLDYDLGSPEYESLLEHIGEKGDYTLSNTPSASQRVTMLSTCDNTHGYRFALTCTWAETYYYNGR